MSYTAIFTAKARKELAEAWWWYEEKQNGLGERFSNCVFEKVNRIEQNPFLFAKRTFYYHEAAVPVFPYLIIYRVNKKKKMVVIVSVFHTSRNPQLKRSR